MCFEKDIKSNKKPRPRIAEKDITVWKIIKKSGYGLYYKLNIDGKKEKWTPGFHYWESTPFKSGYVWGGGFNFKLAINGDAFHSFIVRPIYTEVNREIVEMIIPKGAKYYKNDIHYVSSEIIYP